MPGEIGTMELQPNQKTVLNSLTWFWLKMVLDSYPMVLDLQQMLTSLKTNTAIKRIRRSQWDALVSVTMSLPTLPKDFL